MHNIDAEWMTIQINRDPLWLAPILHLAAGTSVRYVRTTVDVKMGSSIACQGLNRTRAMSHGASASEYLVLSRGQWDENAPPEEIHDAIDRFYDWLERLVDAGKMKPGQRLGTGGATVAKNRVVTDGPFGEAKEIVGGYWFIVAGSLEEATAIAAENPCLQYGLYLEIRPIDPERASAFAVTNETPASRRKGG